ncbi:MAG TPA: signal peptidase II [Ktedonobacteraceae bacterium]|nr:signal peptidase II [Ktedonobacteraceae bacterium]
MTSRRARIYDAIALLTAIIVISLDQWTKTLVASNLGPPDLGPQVPLIGPYLTLYYIRNQGAAFNMFDTNGPVLVVLIAVAVAVIGYLYLRMLNTGTWLYKLIFGLIIGGAAGNLLDRFLHGSVIDFIWFRIPQIGFNFAIFNLADASISVGVVLLFITLLFGGMRSRGAENEVSPPVMEKELRTASSQENDAQS